MVDLIGVIEASTVVDGLVVVVVSLRHRDHHDHEDQDAHFYKNKNKTIRPIQTKKNTFSAHIFEKYFTN